ncbi:unnamed protein product [Arabis nemorensis]|uniref:Uncharacterized protein n=1 Tax=Arabis nemorensis TaxID=586526 RepID=A0A565BDW5_9BRAS|nr:unnamed protein product [Arabis nemorensis]
MAPRKLISLPVWVVIRNIPPQLYSYEGLSIIAYAIDEPLYTDKPIMESDLRYAAKVKISVALDRKQPSIVCVKASLGIRISLRADYPRLPPHSDLCKEFGHLSVMQII